MRLRRTAPTDSEAALAALDAGRYADHLVRRGEAAPAWTWVNTVARGSALLLASLAVADVPHESSGLLLQWYRARKAMAQVVLERTVELGLPLLELQRRALLGLELELAATDGLFERGPLETTYLVIEAVNLGDLRH